MLLYYLHFTVPDISLQTRIYKKYSPVVLIDTHWTVMVFHCYVEHFLHRQSFMLVPHFCNSCCLYLHGKGGPAVTGMVERGFSHWISISTKYTYWTDTVCSRDTNTLLQHNPPKMKDNICHLTYFLMATDISTILSTLSQVKYVICSSIQYFFHIICE